ncbi:hypothetical protein Chor_005738 [Crotalus horridus]
MAPAPRQPCLPLLGRLVLAALACLPPLSDSLAVMSVDLGSESMKIALVKPGVPMEIVLNKESRRKTPVAVALKENERLFGESAVGVVTFRYFQDLLGKHFDNPQVAQYQSWFPEHQLEKDARRETVTIRLSDKLQYSPEEMLGMVLNYSRALAEEFAEQPVKDAVITIPAYFNQAERRAVLHAAKMADLKVLQLINDNTAVALNYGVFRRKDINATAQVVLARKNIMFYDMGASSTVCTIVTYQTLKTKDSGVQPQLQIRGVGFDRTLGGLQMELRLRDHLAKLFNEQHPRKDVHQNLRAMAKLLKEANRVKTVLSANVDHTAQVEGLLDDIDFKAKVSRQEFENLCSDLFKRVAGPVQQALSSAEMSLDEIDQVILVGGATRVPKVQEFLLQVVGKEELGKNINADEAAAMGAVYQAAALSKAFKVKPFIVRDAAMYPIQVEFTREVEEGDKSKSLKHNRRILFQRMGPYPQRKVITFNRYTDDFEFQVNYADMGFLSDSDLRAFGSLNLTKVKLRGVGESFKKHLDYESKGIKAHFSMDESGVLSLDRVESVFETVVEEKPEEESTLTKLGNTISSLFGGGSPGPEALENVTEAVHVSKGLGWSYYQQREEEEAQAELGRDGQKDHAGPATEEDEKQPPMSQEKPAREASATEEDRQEEGRGKGGSKETADKAEAGKGEDPVKSPEKAAVVEEEEEKAKKQRLVEEIAVELDVHDVLELLPEELQSSSLKLQELTKRDLEKHEREKSANSLEAFVFETQELKEKLLELRRVCRSLFFRVEERRKWPDRLAALESLLNHSSIFLRGARMIPEPDQVFTDIELSTLEKAIKETEVWKNETLAEQNKLPPTAKPVLLSKDIEMKIAGLDREVQYLLNKAKFSKPRKRENATRAEASRNTTGSPENGKAAPLRQETREDQLEDASPAKEPPTEKETPLDNELDPDGGSQTGETPKTKEETRSNDEL